MTQAVVKTRLWQVGKVSKRGQRVPTGCDPLAAETSQGRPLGVSPDGPDAHNPSRRGLFQPLEQYRIANLRARDCIMQRRRTVPLTFEEKIEAEKAKLEAQAVKLKPGPQQEALLGKIKELDTATPMYEWLSSPGLQPPKPA